MSAPEFINRMKSSPGIINEMKGIKKVCLLFYIFYLPVYQASCHSVN